MTLVEHPYGLVHTDSMSPLELELEAFRLNPPRGLGKPEHFWRIVSILWGPKSRKPFVRHPWAERMVSAACAYNYVGLCGSGSSGKTDFGAVWAIVNWLALPKGTLVLCTSTSLKDSGRRIWGSIKDYYSAAGLEGVGKLVESLHTIRTDDQSGVFNDKEGITCIAGEKKNEKDAIGKLIGAKNSRVIVIGDELPELTEALLTACLSNLALNPYFQFIGIGNFKSMYDAFGVFVKPKDGYDSIKVEDDEWETDLGICLHFDGLRSPNIIAGRDIWPIYDSKQLAKHRTAYKDENSAEFWRMCRSFPTPLGVENVIYSEADLQAGNVHSSECFWLNEPTKVSSLDPSFTSGGDRCPQFFGSIGKCHDGLTRLRLDKVMVLTDDVRVKVPRDYQIARQFRDNCIREGVQPQHASLDTTAAGSVLWSIIAEEWSRLVLAVNFSGSPSDVYVRANDTNTSKNQFDRRVSELWWVGREFMKYDQIRGITFDVARELKARKYDTVKGPDGLKICVETKKDMKKRLGFSPDLGDAWAVMVDLCRQRLGFLAGGIKTGMNAEDDSWNKEVEKANQLYANVDYSEESYA